MESSQSALPRVLRDTKATQKAIRITLEIEINCKVKQHLQLIELVKQIRRLKMVQKYRSGLFFIENEIKNLRNFIDFAEK